MAKNYMRPRATPVRVLPVTSCELSAATGINLSRLPCRTPCYVAEAGADEPMAARAFWTDPCTERLECVAELTHSQLRSLVTLAMLTPEPLPFAKEI